MEIAYDKIPQFEPGDILEVIGGQNIELEVAKQPLTLRKHGKESEVPDEDDYWYWHGPVYKKMGSNDPGTLVFLKMTLESMPLGVRKLEKEKGFCVDYPYVERVYGLYDVKAKKDTDKNPRLFKALLCEYLEGPSMYRYYLREDFREYGDGIKDRNEEISLFRHFLQLMLAVKFYTEQSYIDTHEHRDIKPDNVIICKDEKRVVVIDFDYAHVPDMKTMRLPFVTAFSMPRGIRCKSVQKDIHALGWTFLFCLTGEVYDKEEHNNPFGIDRNFMLERAEKYLESDYDELMHIIEKMIARPDSRNAYTSLDDLIRDYKEFIKEYAKNENERKEVMTGTELLLQSSDEQRNDNRNSVRIWLDPKNGPSLREDVHNYETRYYAFDKRVGLNFQSGHICIQNVNGELYYMILDDKVETDADKKAFVVKTGDRFWRNNQEITIKVENTRRY